MTAKGEGPSVSGSDRGVGIAGLDHASLTILDLAHACLEVVQGQVRNRALQVVEIHLGERGATVLHLVLDVNMVKYAVRSTTNSGSATRLAFRPLGHSSRCCSSRSKLEVAVAQVNSATRLPAGDSVVPVSQ